MHTYFKIFGWRMLECIKTKAKLYLHSHVLELGPHLIFFFPNEQKYYQSYAS